MSASEAHAAMRRLEEARLLDREERRVRRSLLRNFLIHGVPYAFAGRIEGVTRGIPTAWAAPAFAGEFVSGDQLPPDWPDPDGQVQGASVKPLYSSVPHAPRRDSALYDLLALVDAFRLGPKLFDHGLVGGIVGEIYALTWPLGFSVPGSAPSGTGREKSTITG